MIEPPYAIDDASAMPIPRPAVWQEVPCLGDRDRPQCANRVYQTRTASGLWRPYYCAECDAAWEARRERMIAEYKGTEDRAA